MSATVVIVVVFFVNREFRRELLKLDTATILGQREPGAREYNTEMRNAPQAKESCLLTPPYSRKTVLTIHSLSSIVHSHGYVYKQSRCRVAIFTVLYLSNNMDSLTYVLVIVQARD